MFSQSGSRPPARAAVAGGLVVALAVGCIVSTIVGCSSRQQEAELQRLLAHLAPLPQHASSNEVTVSFCDLAALKERYGFAEVTTLENVPASLMDDFLEVVGLAGNRVFAVAGGLRDWDDVGLRRV